MASREVIRVLLHALGPAIAQISYHPASCIPGLRDESHMLPSLVQGLEFTVGIWHV